MNNKIKFLVIIIFIFLIGLLGWYFIKYKYQSSLTITEEDKKAAQKIEEERIYQEKMTEMNVLFEKSRETDSDLDGLSNEEEKKFGTDPNNSDTDGDGINDKAEVEKFHSNPLKKDTDGDGFEDGYEVRRGYSPVGPGKLNSN